MKRLISQKDLKYYTYLRQVLLNLQLANKDHWWLISDITAYPKTPKYAQMIDQRVYLLLRTSQLMEMLENDDFQWIWAVFSGIPGTYREEEILQYALPHLEIIEQGQYNPYADEPKLQHPLAEFELYAVDSSYMFFITENEDLLAQFQKAYPRYTEAFR